MAKKTNRKSLLITLTALFFASGCLLTSCGKTGTDSSSSVAPGSGVNEGLGSVTFEDATVEYDGQSHGLTIQGTLPKGVTVSYFGNNCVEVGTYVVTAHFSSEVNAFEVMEDLTATLTIVKRKVSIPTLKENNFCYDGTEKFVDILGYDDSLMNLEGTQSASEIGEYHLHLELKDTKNNEWASSFDGNLVWNILSNADYHKVTFYGEDQTTVIYECYVPKGTQIFDIAPDVPSKPGYNSYWDCGGILITEDTEVHVVFEVITYSINYVLNNAEYDGPSSYTIEDADIFLGVPTKPYSTFGGWYTDSTYRNRIMKIAHGSTGDMTLYAKFESNLSITYYDGTIQISTVPLDYGSSFTLPDSYEKDGLPLVAWIIDGTYYTPNKTYTCLFTENVRADALFAKVNTNVNISPDLEGDSAVIIGLANQNTTDLVISEFVQAFDGRYYQATSIGSSAFLRSSSLVSVQMPESITSIKTSAFMESTALTQIQLSSQITKIETATFEGCTSLAQIDLPSGVTDIDTSAFQRCTKLENITLPSELKRIGSNAFFSSGLKTLTIPDGVTTISDTAFGNCLQLSSLTLPKTVETIGYGCFSGSTSLTEITYLGTMTQWNSITLNSGWNGSIQTIHCTDGDISL